MDMLNVRNEYEHLWLQIEKIVFWRIERESCAPPVDPWNSGDLELNSLLGQVVSERFRVFLEEDVRAGRLGGHEMRRAALEKLHASPDSASDTDIELPEPGDDTSDYSVLWDALDE